MLVLGALMSGFGAAKEGNKTRNKHFHGLFRLSLTGFNAFFGLKGKIPYPCNSPTSHGGGKPLLVLFDIAGQKDLFTGQ